MLFEGYLSHMIIYPLLIFFCAFFNILILSYANIKYLMNEPVSMWDWGIYRLDKYFEDLHIEGAQYLFYWTHYDWDGNILILNFTVGIGLTPSNVKAILNFGTL